MSTLYDINQCLYQVLGDGIQGSERERIEKLAEQKGYLELMVRQLIGLCDREIENACDYREYAKACKAIGVKPLRSCAVLVKVAK